MNQKLESIKAALRRAIELSEAATVGPWKSIGHWVGQSHSCVASCAHYAHDADAAFIAHARTFTPAAARALLTAIEGLESVSCRGYDESASRAALATICRDWPEDPQ